MKSLFSLLCLAVVASAYYAPLLHDDSTTKVPGQYIIVYHANTTTDLITAHAQTVGSSNMLGQFEIGTFKGFGAKLSQRQLDRMRKSPSVNYVEVDQTVSISQTCNTQNGATWGIDRVEKHKPEDMDDTYTYNNLAGAGVTSYVIDTGILVSHNEFGGRAVWGANFAGDGQNTDCNGHGTHVAGTMGGTTWGIAKKTTLVAVKVLNCQGSGTNTGVINGINWVAQQNQGKSTTSVANMSLGGSVSAAVNSAVDAASNAGVVMVVAAGNSAADACTFSPASAKSAVCVGATLTDTDETGDMIDERSYFSNFGTCVTLLAPGQNIDSAWHTSNSATRILSGTSMASPHVAGVAALYLSTQSGKAVTPAQVKSYLISSSDTNLINFLCNGMPASCNQTPNRHLFSGCGSSL
jgi:subtilisin family serine protease